MNIDLKQIQALLRLLEKRDVAEFEFEDEHVRLRLVRGTSAAASAVAVHDASSRVSAPPASLAPAPERPTPDAIETDFITSPFVGTFYLAPGPDKPPFVKAGDRFVEGQTLCIIEAMKLMNEIEAECDGVIEEVLVANGQSVEFGTRLFRYRKI